MTTIEDRNESVLLKIVDVVGTPQDAKQAAPNYVRIGADQVRYSGRFLALQLLNQLLVADHPRTQAHEIAPRRFRWNFRDLRHERLEHRTPPQCFPPTAVAQGSRTIRGAIDIRAKPTNNRPTSYPSHFLALPDRYRYRRGWATFGWYGYSKLWLVFEVPDWSWSGSDTAFGAFVRLSELGGFRK